VNINHALSCRSDFSLGESILQVDKMIDRAKLLGYESVALVDIMTISNMVAFSGKAKKAGIKPIIGCTVKVFDDPTYRAPKKDSGEKEKPNRFFWLKVYAKTERGMQSIIRMLAKGSSPEYFYYTARVGIREILELEDVVVSTGDFYNLFHHPKSGVILKALRTRHPDTFVELVAVNTPLFATLNKRAINIADHLGLPVIATRPVLYEVPEQADSLDVLRVISVNGKMTQPWMQKPYVRDFAFGEPVELARKVVETLPAAVRAPAMQNIERLAGLCQYEFKKLRPSLPKMAEDEYRALLQACAAGWKERFERDVLGHRPTEVDLETLYKPRLGYELGVLKKMEFSGYFLLVQDIVRWSKEQGIIVGPGRGSVGGSLVAYLMGITDVDPIRFDLLFERFINPDRIDLPDADLDFMSERRHEVVEYIRTKYGADRVAGVANYNTLGAASALRDVSRVHELSPIEYACSKQVEKVHGVSQNLEESAEAVPDLDKFRRLHPVMWRHATALEGALRGLGQHAAGVVVAGEPLSNRAVVETRSGGPVVNWDKKVVEDWGLVKMDILGLSTLDMLDLGRKYVQERHGVNVDFLALPLDDPKVLAAFGKGDTTGIFQFESPGMRRLLRQLAEGGPITFDDLVAVVALYRPGPLDAGLCDDYVGIKQGAKHPIYEHPNMMPAVASTYGVIVYQEQVMQIARDVAGFTITEADHLRKAMGKKDRDAMAAQREKFVAGCVGVSGMTETAANMFFDKIEVFAGYAFNKSHSVEYSIISYWTMWLKVNYPAEFYAASMTIADKEDRISSLVLDARKDGVQVYPPDINISTKRIEIASSKELYAPFPAILGISEKVADYIMAARKHFVDTAARPIVNRADFYAALSASGIAGKVNKTVREKMEKVGVFAKCECDPIGPLHTDRIKDRLEFLPGFTVDVAKATRGLAVDKLNEIKIVRIAQEIGECKNCTLQGRIHPMPRLGKTPRFMMVFDNPNYKEERAGRLLEGDASTVLVAALKEAGLSEQDGYFTSLVKAGKPREQKTLTNEQINGCLPYLKQELEILKPPVIVLMGSNVVRALLPGLKGGADLVGKVVYSQDLDASFVLGFNPAQILFDPSKVQLLHTICAKINELVN